VTYLAPALGLLLIRDDVSRQAESAADWLLIAGTIILM